MQASLALRNRILSNCVKSAIAQRAHIPVDGFDVGDLPSRSMRFALRHTTRLKMN
ncbi:MAG: hypothetical protein ACREPR_19000 [Brasilonema sp.]